MKCSVSVWFAFASFISILLTWSEAEKETIIEVPYKTGSKWTWSWVRQWQDKTEADGRVFYQVCDVSSQREPNKWIRSNVFHVGEAKRIDVTVKYAVFNCSSGSLAFCKEYNRLAVHKTDANYNLLNPVPEPDTKPAKYEIFGTTSPSNLSTGSLSRNFVNTETYSFLTNSLTPNYYLAIQYQGGCFNLYSVTISYLVCPSLALPAGVIQLPRTIAPINGTMKVLGSCAENAQPLANNISLYGHCKANGEWSSQAVQGECWCKASYGKYLNGSGAVCKACPPGTFQDSPSGDACKPCPLNSVQDVDRTRCDCDSRFYRTKDETILDNCSGQPSAPREVRPIFLNATVAVIQWKAPSNLGGRSDQYYEVECKKCESDGKTCRNISNGILIYHSPSNSQRATIKNLFAYTFYQFKVFAKNGVTHLAEKNGEKSKYAEIVKRTGETFPGAPVLKIVMLNATSVKLSWELTEMNGVIIYYQVTYYPVGEKSAKTVFNTSKSPVEITELAKETKYFFEVRASTSAGLGLPGNETQIIAMPYTKEESNLLSQDQLIGVIVGGVAVIGLIIIIIFVVYYYRRKRKKRSESKLQLRDTEFIPLDGHQMYIDPSTYGSAMEALTMSNVVEINARDLKLDKNIGGGEFADVYKGILSTNSSSEVVAVKILKPRSSAKNKEDFILEASIMGQFKHPNVIDLKGVVTRDTDTPMMIVTEFMENGSLDHFLKKRDGKLTVLQQIGIARGVADGMAYLSGMNFIHRDLAARNILVADNMASKISDFGLSRELDDSEDNPNSEYQTQGGKIPVRWTAPEAIRYKKFSSASDVWSYGILLWEIMSFGERPYWDWDNFQVMDRVEQGYRLPGPMNCPKSIHNIMLDCWEKDKSERPKFPVIVQQLDELIRSPEKITDQPNSRFSVSGTDFGEMKSVEDWLRQIKMERYAEIFESAGYVNLDQVKSLEENDLERLGVRLIGHRNKLNKSIKAMKDYQGGKKA